MEIDADEFQEEIEDVNDDLRLAYNGNLRYNKSHHNGHRILTTKHLFDARKHINDLIEGMKR